MKYKSLYSFDVMEKINDGKQVFVVDKKTRLVHSVNDMSVAEFIQIQKNVDASMRYAFWYEEECEDAEL